MVEVVGDHHLDHIIHAHTEDDRVHVLDAVPDQGKGTGVKIGVQEIEKGHALGKSQYLGTENAKRLGKDVDQSLNLDVVQDPEVIKKIRNILQKKRMINQKNEKKKIRKRTILRLLHLKLKRKINLQHLKKRNPGLLHHREVILGARDHLVNHRGEVVRLVEGKHLNQLRAVCLVTLDAHHHQKDLEQELRLVSVLADLLVEVEHQKNVAKSLIHHKGVPENVVLVVINHVHPVKKDVDAHVHPYVDLHLPDLLLLEELLEHHHLRVHNRLLDLYLDLQ